MPSFYPSNDGKWLSGAFAMVQWCPRDGATAPLQWFSGAPPGMAQWGLRSATTLPPAVAQWRPQGGASMVESWLATGLNHPNGRWPSA